jgi:voltage-gated sodium channel
MIDILDAINYIFLTLYIIELLLKYIAFGFSLLRDGWNVFDLVIISLSSILLTISIIDPN